MLARGKDDAGSVSNFFWGSHPRLQDRLEYLQEGVGTECTWDTTTVSEGYASIKWPMLKVNAEILVDRQEFESALQKAQEYQTRFPTDPGIHFLLGEIHRGLSEVDPSSLATNAYERALELSGGDEHRSLRGLALVAQARRDTSACIGYLESYLADDRRVSFRRATQRTLNEMRQKQLPPPPAAADGP